MEEKDWVGLKKKLDGGVSMNALSQEYGVTYYLMKKFVEAHGYLYKKQTFKSSIHDDSYRKKLAALREKGLSVAEIAAAVGKPERTVTRHLSSFGLTVLSERTDIDDQEVVSLWNDGFTIVEIAKHFSCSHDTITKRLNKYGISCDRASGIMRHFKRTHSDIWEDVKRDIDEGMTVLAVSAKYHIRFESVLSLMHEHKYPYDVPSRKHFDAMEERMASCSGSDEREWLVLIRNYYDQYGNLPVMYLFARFTGRDLTRVKEAVNRYDLYFFFTNKGKSDGALSVMRLLNFFGVRYDTDCREFLRDSDGRILEMDFYLPDYNFGIEVNPTFTHSVDSIPRYRKSVRYHQKKSVVAEEAGIGLLHLYDNDFSDERRFSVLKEQFRWRFSEDRMAVGARECFVKEIDRKESNAFLSLYHFQGSENNSFVRYGLYYGGTLIGVMSFGRSRYAHADYEIIRYCMHPGFVVHGCFNKLFSVFKNVTACGSTVVSYMDLNKRFTADNVYERNGFSYDGMTQPDYLWFKTHGEACMTRYQCTKKRLAALGFDPEKSEIEIMREQYYYRVYGAGSKRYVYTIK